MTLGGRVSLSKHLLKKRLAVHKEDCIVGIASIVTRYSIVLYLTGAESSIEQVNSESVRLKNVGEWAQYVSRSSSINDLISLFSSNVIILCRSVN